MKKALQIIEKNILIFITYSILGWIMEEILYFIFYQKKVNRGLLFGPYLPVYGLGMVILYNLLWKYHKTPHRLGKRNITPILILIYTFFIATITEYISHYLLDTFFHIKLWDYSKKFLNINGRVCLMTSSLFAIGGTISLYFIQPIFEKVYKNMSQLKRHALSTTCLIFLGVDTIHTIISK